MPVIILIVVLAVAAVCAAVFFAVRAYKHRKLAEQLDKRDDDQVHYAFVINLRNHRRNNASSIFRSSARRSISRRLNISAKRFRLSLHCSIAIFPGIKPFPCAFTAA